MPRTLDRSNATLVVVDMQEAFRSAIPEFSLIASRIATAVRGFEILEVPILVTEQYPKGLGPTAEEIARSFEGEFEPVEKSTFSACGASEFVERLKAFGRQQVVLCGIETHVCVNQTAHELIEGGFEVHLLEDAVGSRFEHDKRAGLAKMYSSGAVTCSVEMALFELMRDSKHEKFKAVQNLLK